MTNPQHPQSQGEAMKIESEMNAVGPCQDTCDWCGAQAAWKYGRFGNFIACSKYPKCKWSIKKTRGKQALKKLDAAREKKK